MSGPHNMIMILIILILTITTNQVHTNITDSNTEGINKFTKVRQNCIYEGYRGKYLNPTSIIVTKPISTEFMNKNLKLLKISQTKLEQLCDTRSTTNIVYKIRDHNGKTKSTHTKTAEVCMSQGSIPLPIFASQRRELLSTMKAEKQTRVLANVKLKYERYTKYDGTEIPATIKNQITHCNRANVEGKPFFYIRNGDSMKGPCQTDDDDGLIPFMCELDKSKMTGIHELCINRNQILDKMILDVSHAQKYITSPITNHSRNKRFAPTVLAAGTGIISALAYSVYNNFIAKGAQSAIMEVNNNVTKLQLTTDELAENASEGYEKLFNFIEEIDIKFSEEISTVSKTTAIFEYAKHIYDRTHILLQKIKSQLDECKNSKRTSTVSLNQNDKRKIENKAKSIGLRDETDGLCDVNYRNDTLNLIMTIPLMDMKARTTIYEVTCIPKFKNGEKWIPVNQPKFFAMYDEGKAYTILRPDQFEKCIKANLCFDNFVRELDPKTCGISNHLAVVDECNYKKANDKEPFIYGTPEKTIVSAKPGTEITMECNGRRKHITTTDKALEFPRACEITVGMRSMTPLKQHKMNLNPEEDDVAKYQTYKNENKEDMATHRQIASEHKGELRDKDENIRMESIWTDAVIGTLVVILLIAAAIAIYCICVPSDSCLYMFNQKYLRAAKRMQSASTTTINQTAKAAAETLAFMKNLPNVKIPPTLEKMGHDLQNRLNSNEKLKKFAKKKKKGKPKTPKNSTENIDHMEKLSTIIKTNGNIDDKLNEEESNQIHRLASGVVHGFNPISEICIPLNGDYVRNLEITPPMDTQNKQDNLYPTVENPNNINQHENSVSFKPFIHPQRTDPFIRISQTPFVRSRNNSTTPYVRSRNNSTTTLEKDFGGSQFFPEPQQ